MVHSNYLHFHHVGPTPSSPSHPIGFQFGLFPRPVIMIRTSPSTDQRFWRFFASQSYIYIIISNSYQSSSLHQPSRGSFRRSFKISWNSSISMAPKLPEKPTCWLSWVTSKKCGLLKWSCNMLDRRGWLPKLSFGFYGWDGWSGGL